MLSFDEAQKRVLALAQEPADATSVSGPGPTTRRQPRRGQGAERVALADAVGRVLHSDVRATTPIPSFDSSTMDGYAVRASEAGEALPVRGESRAGGPPSVLLPRSAGRIFTGAPLPAGADAVVMQEEATRDGDVVRFKARPVPGAFVRSAGDDLKVGEVALARGSRVGAREVAMLSSLDLATVEVARRPHVVIVPTGDELRSPGTAGASSSIPESSSLALATMARFGGATADVHAPASDDREHTAQVFKEALATCDVLVTVGGVSVGEHDVVRGALEACGVTLDFWRVALKPGKPLAVGRRGATIVLALPGNPVSALVTFGLFGVPLVRALQGDAKPRPSTTKATLGAPITRTPSDRLELARARIERDEAVVLAQQSSAAVIGLCLADILVCVPPHTASLDRGSSVDAYRVGDLGL